MRCTPQLRTTSPPVDTPAGVRYVCVSLRYVSPFLYTELATEEDQRPLWRCDLEAQAHPAAPGPAGKRALLPDTFTWKAGTKVVGERQLRNLIVHGQVVPIASGIYRRADWNGDEGLAEVATRSPQSTICLRSALARHDLIDDIPATIDIAIPRGAWTPTVQTIVAWHHFDARTFDLGRDEISLTSDLGIGLYSPERCVVDAFRLRAIEGPELGVESLKAWLRAGGQPSALLQLARHFSRAEGSIRSVLQVLL